MINIHSIFEQRLHKNVNFLFLHYNNMCKTSAALKQKQSEYNPLQIQQNKTKKITLIRTITQLANGHPPPGKNTLPYLPYGDKAQ